MAGLFVQGLSAETPGFAFSCLEYGLASIPGKCRRKQEQALECLNAAIQTETLL